MTKKELANTIAEETKLTQIVVKDIMQRLFDGIIDTLEKEGRIELRNFGVFDVKQRKARKARNPRTGESVMVPAKLAVTFTPGLEMKEKVGQIQKASNDEQ